MSSVSEVARTNSGQVGRTEPMLAKSLGYVEKDAHIGEASKT
jgi:hypothetical protein